MLTHGVLTKLNFPVFSRIHFCGGHQVYEPYAPYQFLVYWYEIRQSYEKIFGPLIEMDPANYAKATGEII
jgi:hypothetical protein